MNDELRGVLRDVSRTYYISLRWVPTRVRDALSLAYLLARASDTFADVTGWPDARKIEALEAFRTAFEAAEHIGPVVEAGISVAETAEHGLTVGEVRLMRNLAEVLERFWRMPIEERTLMRAVLETISRGQTADIGRVRIGSAADLDHYTYQVAGCVGEFWTRLCSLRLPRFARAPVDELVAHAVRLGQGLQLVNILRDVPKDGAAGRSYLPGVEADAHGAEKWRAAQPWLHRAREGLAAGREYVRAVRGMRNKFVVWLPLLLGEATLDLIESDGPAAMAAPVKVQRWRVKRLALEAAWRSAVN
jgi:farnesyl-diphosphate farnesyltransferase